MYYFCSENSLYVIGGWQNGTNSNKTWIVNPTKGFQLIEGPPLNKARALHSCGKMEVNGNDLIVVAGGIGLKSNLDSVEILDPKLGSWRFGMAWSFKLAIVQ